MRKSIGRFYSAVLRCCATCGRQLFGNADFLLRVWEQMKPKYLLSFSTFHILVMFMPSVAKIYGSGREDGGGGGGKSKKCFEDKSSKKFENSRCIPRITRCLSQQIF